MRLRHRLPPQSRLMKFKPVWLPSDLFALSQPGIWPDGSDNSVMWQDAAGTTPVTALGQPVGLVLDKRLWGGKTFEQMLAAQPEIIPSPNLTVFSPDNGMQIANEGAGVERISGGGLSVNMPNASTQYLQFQDAAFSFKADALYEFTVVIENYVSGSLRGRVKTGTITTIGAGNGVHKAKVRAGTGTSSGLLGTAAAGGFVGDVKFLSVREIPGNHAYQDTSASRPVWQEDDLGARGLLFDGVNDFLITPSIDFSASDKMLVSAGVRKLSDAAVGVVGELGDAGIGANTGVFSIAAPLNTSTQRYGVYSKGTAGGWAPATSAQFTAPHTAILTGQCDIGGDSVRLRVNGSQVAENTGDQGTGNYGNYPLYIGMRAGTSLPFNGFIHQLVIRGGTLPDADELAQLEAYIAAKSKVTL